MDVGTASARSDKGHFFMITGLRRRRLRNVVRHIALSSAAAWDRCTLRTTIKQTNRVHILLLHHVFEHEVDAFRQLIGWLCSKFRIIAYSDAIERILSNKIDGAYLAISFDDGLQCCRRAANVLHEFGARACFFVCPSIVSETSPATIARFCRERLHYSPVEFLDWDDLEELRDQGHEIGGHTMRHARLSDMDAIEAADDIGQTYYELSARLGFARHFAWPYGRFADVTGAAVRAVFDVGFGSCASGVRGCHGSAIPNDDLSSFMPQQLCLRRESIESLWPRSHIDYFLRRSARRPVTIEETWPAALRATPVNETRIPCASLSMRFPSGRAVA